MTKSSYPDIMENNEITYLGKDCNEHLANTKIEYEEKILKILKIFKF